MSKSIHRDDARCMTLLQPIPADMRAFNAAAIRFNTISGPCQTSFSNVVQLTFMDLAR